jgi:ABC-type glutathione transport system ATPase component
MTTDGEGTSVPGTVAVRDLRVHTADRELVHGVDLDIARGERVGLIGESGSGKSLTAYAMLGLLDEGLSATGEIRIDGVPGNVLTSDERTLSKARGRTASIVFQEPMTALNPLMKVGDQVAEALLWHGTARSRSAARAAATELLARVRLPDPARAAGSYPHQLSGGQRQRVVLAIALANDPALLICDEPTTALDVTVQAQVLELVSELVRASGTALLFISHDLAVVASMADRVVVMRNGEIVEQGPTAQVLGAPRHPYTRALLEASEPGPGLPGKRPVSHDVLPRDTAEPSPVFLASTEPPLIRGRDLRRDYHSRRGILAGSRTVQGLRGVSFDIAEGAKVGIVGESGSGKSTLLRLIAGLDRPTGGTVEVAGTNPSAPGRAGRDARRRLRDDVAVVFQDPTASLDPRMRVGSIVAEPLRGISRAESRERVRTVLTAVGLDGDTADRYPHQFSGGQRQRISIARALVTRPRILVADEPVSALDVSVRGQVLELIQKLADEYELTLLLIAHDLGVVAQVCDQVLVLSDGAIVEGGPVERVYAEARHPFTAELVGATPRLSDALAG